MAMKGISPVVASVLLIGISVAVAVMLSSWITHWMGTRTQDISSACVTSTNYRIDSATFRSSSSNMTLMLRPAIFGDLYLASDAGLHANLSDPTLLPRFLHFVVGAFALTGIAVAWLGRVRARRHDAEGAWILAFGIRLFSVATLVQLAVGAWFVASQPEYIRRVLLGGGPDSMVLAMGIVFALLAIPLMRMSVALATIAGATAVADMVIVRHLVRTLALTPYFRPDTIPVNPQLGVFLVFAVLLIAGLVTVAWMVTRLVVGRGEQTEGVGN